MEEKIPPSILLSEFGDFLSLRKKDIVEKWLRSVRADSSLETADVLPEPLLKDHIPALLDSFDAFLRSGDSAADRATQENASRHGAERWIQGYSLRELIREIYRLRTVMFQEVVGFAAGRPDGLSVLPAAGEAVDRFLNDLECRSVETFARESEASLRKSNDVRLGLMRTVAHELRNMLNSMGLAFALLETADAGEIETVRGNIDRNSTHMREVLDDLLDLSILLSPRAAVEPAPVALQAVLDSVDSGNRRAAEEKGLRFQSSLQGGLTSVFSDAGKIRQIADNLVSNAIKYTPSGEVSFRFETIDSDWWAIVVADTGIGIAAKDRKHILSTSYEAASESPLRGAGLGMAIVAALVDLMGGSIHLDSAIPSGSVFKVTLPRTHGAGAANPLARKPLTA